jgi:hypothetical protein
MRSRSAVRYLRTSATYNRPTGPPHAGATLALGFKLTVNRCAIKYMSCHVTYASRMHTIYIYIYKHMHTITFARQHLHVHSRDREHNVELGVRWLLLVTSEVRIPVGAPAVPLFQL